MCSDDIILSNYAHHTSTNGGKSKVWSYSVNASKVKLSWHQLKVLCIFSIPGILHFDVYCSLVAWQHSYQLLADLMASLTVNVNEENNNTV